MEQKISKKCIVWGYPAWTIPDIGRITKLIGIALIVIPGVAMFVGPLLNNIGLVDGVVTFAVVAHVILILVGLACVLTSRIDTIKQHRGTIFVLLNGRFYTANIFANGFLARINYYDDASYVDMALIAGSAVATVTPFSVFMLPVNLLNAFRTLISKETDEESTRYVLRECIQNNKLEKYIVAGKLNDFLEPIHIIEGVEACKKGLKIHYKTHNNKKYISKKLIVEESITNYEGLKRLVYSLADKFKLRCPACGREMGYGVCEFCGHKVRKKIDVAHILHRIFVSGK